jgi:hypothetical protein
VRTPSRSADASRPSGRSRTPSSICSGRGWSVPWSFRSRPAGPSHLAPRRSLGALGRWTASSGGEDVR